MAGLVMVLIAVGTLAFIMVLVSVICGTVSMKFYNTGTKTPIGWWLYHAKRISQVKKGEKDPWGKWEVSVVSPFECFSFRVLGIVWLTMPIVIIATICYLATNIWFWLGTAIIVGLWMVLRIVSRTTNKILGVLGTLGEKGNVITVWRNRLSRLSKKLEEEEKNESS